ncbi:hypothetical protein JW848_04850 [Candidatus Bipolaricaulota bacterium]|nr:hypothetical protein [Candidatus Bipolaricaulota bacterium]
MTRRRFVATPGWITILNIALLLAAASFASARDVSAPVFGFGGSFVGALSIGDGPWREQLEISGLEAIPDLWTLSGASGRAGVVGGWSLGGVGWGTSATMTSADGLASLEIGAGFGGLDAGAAFAGDKRSFVTAGAVFGIGISRLTLRLGAELGEGALNGTQIEVGSTVHCSTSVFLSVAPYLSMQVQPFSLLGFELRFGTLLELASVSWRDEAMPRSLPELRFRGPWATLGVSWGWSGCGGGASEAIERVEQVSVPISDAAIVVENAIGDIVIRFDAASDARPTEAQRMVSGTATVRAPAEIADSIGIETSVDEDRVVVRSETPERAGGWRVDYDLRVPAGTQLELDLGIGDARIVGLAGRCRIRAGVGNIHLETLAGESLLVSVGVGSVTIGKLLSRETSLAVESGRVDVRLAGEASADITATVGLGDVEISGFPQAITLSQGTVGHDFRATLGARPAEQQLIIRVGVGAVLIGVSDSDDSIDLR